MHKASDSGNIRHGKMSGPDQVNQVLGRVGLTRIFHMNLFLKKNKENNIYLSFGKLSNKSLDVKCITFKIIQILTLLSETK